MPEPGGYRKFIRMLRSRFPTDEFRLIEVTSREQGIGLTQFAQRTHSG